MFIPTKEFGGLAMKVRTLIAACAAILTLAATQLVAQCDKPQTKLSEKAESELTALVSQAMASSGPETGMYLSKALKAVYGVDVNKSAHDIIKGIKSDSGWSDLGAATDQSVLDKAQQSANCGTAVLAVWVGADGSGHAALVLPGSESMSSTWKLKAPNSASFFVNNPKKSFAGKALSYSFNGNSGLELYVKK
jgi:hypothetical protein